MEHWATRVERLSLIFSFFSNRLAPYERRVIELLRNSKDKRARKLAKKRVRVSFPLSPYQDAVYYLPWTTGSYPDLFIYGYWLTLMV